MVANVLSCGHCKSKLPNIVDMLLTNKANFDTVEYGPSRATFMPKGKNPAHFRVGHSFNWPATRTDGHTATLDDTQSSLQLTLSGCINTLYIPFVSALSFAFVRIFTSNDPPFSSSASQIVRFFPP